jgi:hypothetical protein
MIEGGIEDKRAQGERHQQLKRKGGGALLLKTNGRRALFYCRRAGTCFRSQVFHDVAAVRHGGEHPFLLLILLHVR